VISYPPPLPGNLLSFLSTDQAIPVTVEAPEELGRAQEFCGGQVTVPIRVHRAEPGRCLPCSYWSGDGGGWGSADEGERAEGTTRFAIPPGDLGEVRDVGSLPPP